MEEQGNLEKQKNIKIVLDDNAEKYFPKAFEVQQKLDSGLPLYAIPKDDYQFYIGSSKETTKLIKVEDLRNFTSEYLKIHKELVEKALKTGKPVYEGWEKDYPELIEKYAKEDEKKIEVSTEKEISEKNQQKYWNK
jgi:hypothetical protein